MRKMTEKEVLCRPGNADVVPGGRLACLLTIARGPLFP